MEKKEELFKKELEDIRYILRIQPFYRTKEHCITILNFLKERNYLKKMDKKKLDDMQEFARELKLEDFEENQWLFKEGEIGFKYYIILKGKVKGFIYNRQYFSF